MTASSMRARMTLAFTAAAAALLVLAGGGLLWYAWRAAGREADTVLREAAGQFGAEVDGGGRRAALSELEEERSQRRAQGIAMVLYGSSGRRLWASDAAVPPASGATRGEWRIRTLPVGADTVLFGVAWEKTEQHLRREALALAALSLIVLLGTALGAWATVGRTLSPIERLSEQAARASADALGVRLSAPSGDAEVVDLVRTLNGFLDRLYEATAARQRFYAAASHELRTPLQALQGHLELALSRRRTVEEYEAMVTEAFEQTGYLSRLVQDLLALNRLQSGSGEGAAERVDLTAAVERAVAACCGLAGERRVRVEMHLAETALIVAPETHVEMLARNVVENAVKYAREGSPVEIALRSGAAPALTVANETGRIEPLDGSRLFEPFYRPDAARQSQTGGNGLGLAICKAAADANGWAISLRQEASTVTVTVIFKSRPGV